MMQAVVWTDDSQSFWCINVSLGLEELKDAVYVTYTRVTVEPYSEFNAITSEL